MTAAASSTHGNTPQGQPWLHSFPLQSALGILVCGVPLSAYTPGFGKGWLAGCSISSALVAELQGRWCCSSRATHPSLWGGAGKAVAESVAKRPSVDSIPCPWWPAVPGTYTLIWEPCFLYSLATVTPDRSISSCSVCTCTMASLHLPIGLQDLGPKRLASFDTQEVCPSLHIPVVDISVPGNGMLIPLHLLISWSSQFIKL